MCAVLTMISSTLNAQQNNLAYAVAWKQTAAEHAALYYQGFNIAKMQVEAALSKRSDFGKPLAIISDIDETLLLSNSYWGYMVVQEMILTTLNGTTGSKKIFTPARVSNSLNFVD